MNFSERLNFAMQKAKVTQGALAKSVGMAQSSIWKLTSGAAKSSTKVVEIAKVLGVRPEWLASGIEPMTDNNNKLKHSELKNTRLKLNIFEEMKNQDLEEFVEIPLLDVKLSAGNGSYETDERSKICLLFRRYSLKKMGVHPQSARLVRISGNSMEPALNDGDVVGINTDKTSIEDGKTYAISHDDVLRVKTLISAPGKIIIRSVNREEYPDEIMTLIDFKQYIRIIGQVFWSSHAW
ncbi:MULTISPECIES: helix-turn-helix transcriptional regulator [Arsenophonus]|uniref:XRE family transcriptional regulator n=1 Tax=Arsenophonus TaxID=637 RepID=UPI001CDCA772|nr:helix-turn-helix transcriptional regulator [Arsenophonus apicola]UBX27940.1 helix-turn-helix transcriptional regulator [Arsenophonus apicola]